MNKSDWIVWSEYNQLKEAANRNGFDVVRCDADNVKIVTSMPPYAKNTSIFRGDSFSSALAFMRGYEQHKFEIEHTK